MSTFLPNYAKLLDWDDAIRYSLKVSLCGGVDPYEVCLKETDNDYEKNPNVSREDTVGYLVLATELYTLQQLKALKGTGGHNFVSSGHVEHLSFLKIPGEKTIVFGKVKHSQRANESPLCTWVLFWDYGGAIRAHCNCMAGNASSCSHVSAVFFALEVAAKRKNSATCTSKLNSWLPPSLRTVEPCEVQKSNFQSADRQFEKLLESAEVTNSESEAPDLAKLEFYAKCAPSLSEQTEFLKEVEKTDPGCGVFLVTRDFQDRIVATLPNSESNDLNSSTQRLPKELNFFDKCKENLSFVDLLRECEELFKKMSISDEESTSLERATRSQTKTPLWMQHRKGRITASVMKDACHTDPANPAISTVNKVCYPLLKKVENKHTRRGKREEPIILQRYIDHMKNDLNHGEFQLRPSGLCVNPQYPHIGASPDGIATCECHGTRLVEVKSIDCDKKENTGLVQ